MVYVPAAKTTREQLGAFIIALCSALWLMPLFRLIVGPPHPTGAGPGVGFGVGVGVGFEETELTTSEVCAVADE
jgi:hypothetical protein